MNTVQDIQKRLEKTFDLSPDDISFEFYEEGDGEEVWCTIPTFRVEHCWLQNAKGRSFGLSDRNHPYKVLKRKILATGKVRLS
ncbi:hypothetical protein ISTM_59 [Insectomime virus]|nr:hypothetical protein ISTM_59 [Insectomime virus]